MKPLLHSRVIAAALTFSVFGMAPLSARDAAAEAGESESKEQRQRRAQRGDGEPVTTDVVTVTARGTAADFPSALATDHVFWQDASGSPSDFQDLIVRQPGIGATGQNGLFETFSIRGSGASGILVLAGGMPLSAQRRAGIPVSFVEPSLLGEINVTRGPATVHFGPGALGGAISIEPRWFESATAAAGYADSGNESQLMAGFGNAQFSFGAARHRAGDSEAANGTPLNTSFERESASLQARTELGDFEFDALLLPSRTTDIGKSNNRYPVRDTTYPEDQHTLGRARLRHQSGFEINVRGHDQSLLTYNQRPNTPDTFASIESLDIGATVQHTFETGDFTNNVGLDFEGRRNVNGFDARGTLANRTFSLRDADENAFSLFGISDWRVTDRFSLEFGARYSTIEQEQLGADADDADGAFSAGAIWKAAANQRVTLSLSSGYRFPTLEERFFTGVTPQGQIVGNADLGSERSLGLDLGYAWHADAWDAQFHLWRTEVDDLIQLFAIAPGINGYTSIGAARLHGIDASLGWTPAPGFSLRGIGTLVRSRDERSGDPLYGSPPPTVSIEARYDFASFSAGAFYTHRWKMDRPGFEEVERDALDLLDASLTWHFAREWDAEFFVRNAFNEDYYATSDQLSAFGPERSFGLNLRYTLH